MTTETTGTPRDTGTRVLVRAALASAAVGLVVSVVGGLTGGSAAAGGALVGTALVVLVFGLGTVSVNLVAHVMPTAALLVALLTYALQVVVLGLVFAALSGSGALEETLDRSWLAGTVIAGTVAWLAVQVVVSTTRRIPVYDLPEPAYAGTASGPGEGGAA